MITRQTETGPNLVSVLTLPFYFLVLINAKAVSNTVGSICERSNIKKKICLTYITLLMITLKIFFTRAGSCQVEISADLFVFLVSRLYSACLHY